jgi:hypothetical protein
VRVVHDAEQRRVLSQPGEQVLRDTPFGDETTLRVMITPSHR